MKRPYYGPPNRGAGTMAAIKRAVLRGADPAAVRRAVAQGADPRLAVSSIKRNAQRPEIARITKQLASDPDLSTLVVADPFPRNVGSLKVAPCLTDGDLDCELYWTACVLRLYTDEINTFVVLRDQFARAILAAEYTEADAVLSEKQRKLGNSIWLLENRIGLLAEWKGLERQKEYTLSITRQKAVQANVRYLAHYLSVRAEQNVSADRFSKLVGDSLSDPNDRSERVPSADYLTFKLDFFGGTPFHQLPDLISRESNSAIIDRYETFLRVCQLALAYHKDERTTKSVARALDVLKPDIHDGLIGTLAAVVTGRSASTSEASSILYRILDLYTTGQYQACVSEAVPLINSDPTNIALLELFVKASYRLDSFASAGPFRPSIQRLLDAIASVLLLDEYSSESQLFLAKLLRVHASQPWAAQLHSFLMREYSHDTHEVPDRFVIFGELNASVLNPRIGAFLRRTRFPRSLDKSAASSDSPSQQLLALTVRPTKNSIELLKSLPLPEERFLRHAAQIQRELGEFEDALVKYKALMPACPRIVYYDVMRRAVLTEIAAGNLLDALLLIVNACLVNDQAAVRLPTDALIKRLQKNPPAEVFSMIEWPIVLDLHFKRTGLFEQERSEAYEQYLDSINTKRPSQIDFAKLATNATAYSYFLRNLCVPEVMDTSVYFTSTEDVQRERLRICQMLLESDPANADSYLTEMRTLTTRIAVAQGVRELEQSKIYVDVDGVKRTLEKELSESYARYIALLRHTPHDDTTEKLVRALQHIARSTEREVEIYIPPSEKSDLFTSMVRDVRDGFVSSNEYGLDTSLSMGIRHGTLAGQLRPRLEAAHLVTLKESKGGRYQSNTYWLNRLPRSAEDQKVAVSGSLNAFSESVDTLIDRINRIWLQVRTEAKHPEGMFDFRLSEVMLHRIRLRVIPETTFDQFFDLVVQEMWALTDESLSNITSHLTSAVKPQFLALLDRLFAELAEHGIGHPFAEILHVITQAKIDLQYDIERVTSWFARARPAEVRDYPAKLPVDIGLQTLEHVYAGKLVQPAVIVDEPMVFKGKTLTGMAHIMFNLFDNVRKYSNATSGGDVQLTIHRLGSIVRFTMRNSVPADVDIKAEDTQLAEIRESIATFRIVKKIPIDRVKREGRSGFYKIAKVLLFDFLADCDLVFGFDNNRMFEVRFTLPASTLLA